MHARTCLTIALVSLLSAAANANCPEPNVQQHLARVEGELLAGDVSHLSQLQLERRLHHIAVLARYREQCAFPQNRAYPDRLVSIFVDDDATHCAVGYLMAESGADALVERIRTTRNTASIWELADDPDVADWLVDNGLSLYEVARIQPAYCFQNLGGSCLCGTNATNPFGAVSALVEGKIVAVDIASSSVAVSVDVVHGSGVVVGDTKTGTYVDGDVIGRKVMLVVHDPNGNGLTVSRGAERVGDDIQCTSGVPPEAAYCARLPFATYIEALFSEDCAARVLAEDPKFGVSVCALGGAACNVVESDGCIGGNASILALVLLALHKAGLRRK